MPRIAMFRTDPPHVLDSTMFWGPAGGVRRALSAKHERLAAHGWRHTVLAPGAAGAGMLDCGGIALPGSGGYRIVLSRQRCARQIVRQQPDLLESADPYRLAWATLDAARRLAVPAIAFCHSNLPQLIGRRFGSALERRAREYLLRLYAQFNAVLAPSRAMAGALRAWGLPHAQHQPLGVDCAVFRPERRDAAWRRSLLQRFDLPRRTRLLVYVGRFAPEKNLQVLADAVGLLGRDHALLLVGSGPSPPHGPRVFRLGNQLDAHALARTVASCDAFVHAGDQETFGLALLEAMACGTPVVASAREGVGELASGVGCLVESLHAPRWAEAIAATTDPLCRPPTRAALARARQHDWSFVVASMAQRYERLLRTRALGVPAYDMAPASVLGEVVR